MIGMTRLKSSLIIFIQFNYKYNVVMGIPFELKLDGIAQFWLGPAIGVAKQSYKPNKTFSKQVPSQKCPLHQFRKR